MPAASGESVQSRNFLRLVLVLGSLHQRRGFKLVAGALGGDHHGDGEAFLHRLDARECERGPDGELARPRGLAGPRSGFDVLRHVGVEILEIFPALLLAHLLQNADDLEIARARRDGIGHDDLALEFGIEQIPPILGQGQSLGFRAFVVDAEGRHVAGRREPLVVGGVIGRRELFGTLGLVGLDEGEDARVHHVRDGPAPDHVVLRIGRLGQNARAEIARGETQNLQVDTRQALLRRRHIFGDLIFLEGGVGRHLPGLGRTA